MKDKNLLVYCHGGADSNNDESFDKDIAKKIYRIKKFGPSVQFTELFIAFNDLFKKNLQSNILFQKDKLNQHFYPCGNVNIKFSPMYDFSRVFLDFLVGSTMNEYEAKKYFVKLYVHLYAVSMYNQKSYGTFLECHAKAEKFLYEKNKLALKEYSRSQTNSYYNILGFLENTLHNLSGKFKFLLNESGRIKNDNGFVKIVTKECEDEYDEDFIFIAYIGPESYPLETRVIDTAPKLAGSLRSDLDIEDIYLFSCHADYVNF